MKAITNQIKELTQQIQVNISKNPDMDIPGKYFYN
jgi:hypothetical protein